MTQHPTQDSQSELDEILNKVYADGEYYATHSENVILDGHTRRSIKNAKQALLQWRDKAVVEARIDELEWLLQEHDAQNSFGYFIEDRLKQLKETPNED